MNSLLNLPLPVEFIINDDSRTELDFFQVAPASNLHHVIKTQFVNSRLLSRMPPA
jgi:hypothetical protein